MKEGVNRFLRICFLHFTKIAKYIATCTRNIFSNVPAIINRHHDFACTVLRSYTLGQIISDAF